MALVEFKFDAKLPHKAKRETRSFTRLVLIEKRKYTHLSRRLLGPWVSEALTRVFKLDGSLVPYRGGRGGGGRPGGGGGVCPSAPDSLGEVAVARTRHWHPLGLWAGTDSGRQ